MVNSSLKKSYVDSHTVIEKEKEYLGIEDHKKTMGLALSGGGIRSASFGLGVLQALLEHGLLNKMDYLSTVSGGGYIGSALSWFRKRHHGDLSKSDAEHFFDETNPLGVKGEGVRSGGDDKNPKNSKIDDTAKKSNGNTFLDFLRQHGNYLSPSDHLTFVSAIGVLIRNLILSFAIYFFMLIVVFSMLMLVSYGAAQLPVFEKYVAVPLSKLEKQKPASDGFIKIDIPDSEGELALDYNKRQKDKGPSWGKRSFFHLCVFFAVVFAFLFVLSGITFSFSSWPAPSRDIQPEDECTSYRCRNLFQEISGRLLQLFLLFVVLATVPVADALLSGQLKTVGFIGYVSGIWAALAKMRRSMGGENLFKASWIGDRLFELGAMVFIYVLLVWAYHCNAGFRIPTEACMPIEVCSLWSILVVAGSAIILGYFVNINYASLGRMYRDRLMEAFLPNDDAVKNNKWMEATQADKTMLFSMCRDGDGKVIKPYHLINNNIILTNADQEKFRGRGGDSFLLSPKYCGSDATGYIRTRSLMRKSRHKGGLTLATAMAVSGAAANPHTGVAGQGPTRGPLVSLLMTIFNLRLGCWFSNPQQNAPYRMLNYFRPGVCSLLNIGYKETSDYIEITDGGHFENLGLYELIRRQVDVIIVSDAGADKDFTFGDLSNAIERVRTDFGVNIRFEDENEELNSLLPGSYKKDVFAEKFNLAQKGYVRGIIKYPNKSRYASIYLIKTTLVPRLPADVYGYRARHKDFPDQTTADQFFDENQFEAYRELGYRATDSMCLKYKDELNA